MYWEFYELGGRQAVRQGNWKYVKLNVRDQKKPIIQELYKLETDLSETNNVVNEHPEVVKKMEAIMQQAHEEHELISLFSMEKNAKTAF